jgi:hypothetical protein
VEKKIKKDQPVHRVDQTEIVTKRERTTIADVRKVAIMKDLLDIIADEDLDAVFLAMLENVKGLGYKLRGTPEELLEAVNNGA